MVRARHRSAPGCPPPLPCSLDPLSIVFIDSHLTCNATCPNQFLNTPASACKFIQAHKIVRPLGERGCRGSLPASDAVADHLHVEERDGAECRVPEVEGKRRSECLQIPAVTMATGFCIVSALPTPRMITFPLAAQE